MIYIYIPLFPPFKSLLNSTQIVLSGSSVFPKRSKLIGKASLIFFNLSYNHGDLLKHQFKKILQLRYCLVVDKLLSRL